MTKKEKDILNRIGQLVLNGELSKDFLVQNFIQSGNLLNLRTVSDYAKANKMTYRGVLKSPQAEKITLFNVKFVINND